MGMYPEFFYGYRDLRVSKKQGIYIGENKIALLTSVKVVHNTSSYHDALKKRQGIDTK